MLMSEWHNEFLSRRMKLITADERLFEEEKKNDPRGLLLLGGVGVAAAYVASKKEQQ